MIWHLLSDRGLHLRPTDKMLIGFTLTLITMTIVAVSGFRGSDAVVEGGPAALSAAENTAKLALESQPSEFSVAANSLVADQLSQKAVRLAASRKSTPEQRWNEQWAAMSVAVREYADSFSPKLQKSDAGSLILWPKNAADALQRMMNLLDKTTPDAEALKEAAKPIEENAKNILNKSDASSLSLFASVLAANSAVRSARASSRYGTSCLVSA